MRPPTQLRPPATLLALLLVTALAVGADPAPRGDADLRLRSDDLFDLVLAGDPRLSPDGERVVYLEIGFDAAADRIVSRLWLADVADGDRRPLTAAGSHLDWQPRWTPDGRAVVFLSDRGGTAQIYHVAVDGSTPRRISRLDVEPRGLAVSPDGERVAFFAQVPGPSPLEGVMPEPPPGADGCRFRPLERGASRTGDRLPLRGR